MSPAPGRLTLRGAQNQRQLHTREVCVSAKKRIVLRQSVVDFRKALTPLPPRIGAEFRMFLLMFTQSPLSYVLHRFSSEAAHPALQLARAPQVVEDGQAHPRSRGTRARIRGSRTLAGGLPFPLIVRVGYQCRS